LKLPHIFPSSVGISIALQIPALNRQPLQNAEQAFLPGANDGGMLRVEQGEVTGSRHTVE
jgi:hypothetical protein